MEKTRERLMKYHEKNIVTKFTKEKVGTPSHLKNFVPEDTGSHKDLV